ncbi:MAG: hypothetical protein IKF68_07560 [Erysipelotrichaceae bacterium]|nr:hypothetical protein [Erysipelotrichaceae bacterium]
MLTLYFDDVVKEVEGTVMFSDEQADMIIDFIDAHKDVDTLMIHCYGGESRSRAVAAFAMEYMGQNGQGFLETGRANEHVYDVLQVAWIRRQLKG